MVYLAAASSEGSLVVLNRVRTALWIGSPSADRGISMLAKALVKALVKG